MIETEDAIDTILERVIQIRKDKEIAEKVPSYATLHTMQTFTLTFEMKSMAKDMRQDEMFILHDIDDGAAEPLPPGKDSICTDKLLNKQELIDKRYADTSEINAE